MKKILVVISLLLCGLSTPVSAQNIEKLFLTAPELVLPLLEYNSRADLLDYNSAGMNSGVRNLLSGYSYLPILSKDYLKLDMTDISTMQIKLLPTDADTVICVVNSVRAEVEDSRISFFDKSWNRLPTEQFFNAPGIKDFFRNPDSANIHMKVCDIYLVSLKLNAVDDSMVAEYTMPGYMSEDAAATITPLLRRLVYRWENGRFVLENEL